MEPKIEIMKWNLVRITMRDGRKIEIAVSDKTGGAGNLLVIKGESPMVVAPSGPDEIGVWMP